MHRISSNQGLSESKRLHNSNKIDKKLRHKFTTNLHTGFAAQRSGVSESLSEDGGRERGRQTDRDTERERETETDRDTERKERKGGGR